MLKNRLIFWNTLYDLSYMINHIRLTCNVFWPSATHVFYFRKFFVYLQFRTFVCSRTWKPQEVLVSKFSEVLRLHLILSTFLSIFCAQGTTLIKQCSKVSTKTYHWSLKVVLFFLETKLLLRYQIGSFLAVF